MPLPPAPVEVDWRALAQRGDFHAAYRMMRKKARPAGLSEMDDLLLAADVARELQKSRVEAVSTSLGVRAFVYADRVELRPWVAGATAGAAPRAPTSADPVARLLRAPEGVVFTGVVPSGLPAPAPGTLSATVHADLDFSNQGTAQLLGQPVPTGATVYLQNGRLPANSPDFDFRIDVTALTGYVSVRAN